MRALPLTGVPGRSTRRLAAMVLVGQAMAVTFGALVARGFAVAEGHQAQGTAYLLGGAALALVCLLTTGLLRRRYGVTLGWLVQLLTLAGALVLPAMVVVALIFGGLWVAALTQGHKMDELTRRWADEEPGA